MKLTLVAWQKLPDRDYELKLRTKHFERRWLFWKRTIVSAMVVRGDCTVWSEFPSGARCGSSLEHKFCEFWKQIRWGMHDDKEIK